MKRIAILGTIIYTLSFAAPVLAQSASYWCPTGQGASYWSYQPCQGGYPSTGSIYSPQANLAQTYSYGYQNPNYQYYYPQNNYYPNNYYNYYGNNYGNYGYQYYYPAPTCSITYTYANNPNYWSGGMYSQAIQLTWSSNYASSAYISGIGATSPSGTRIVYPYGNAQYSMTVYGQGGSNTCTTYYQQMQYYPQQPPYYWNQYNYNPSYQYYY